jgi:hypothetical protein
MYALACEHHFCLGCLKNMFKVNINEGNVGSFKCVNLKCMFEYYPKDIKIIVNDRDLIQKYEQFLKNAEVDKDENKLWCPYLNCGEFV